MNDTLLLFLTIPTITAFIGYITNWAAVKMMFSPAEPVGIGALSWQGIVYRMSDKFATEISGTTSQVLEPADLLARLDLPGLVDRVLAEHGDAIDVVVGRVVEQIAPGVWGQMEPVAKANLQQMLLAQIQAQMDETFAELGPRMSDMLDLEGLVVQELTGENAERLARVADEIGGKELRFVEWSGGVFGVIVGLLQAALFSVFGIWWTMPIVGGIVGLGTNWLAVQMIFRPLEPKRYLGVPYQGLFPKRQQEIARDYGQITEREIFTPAKLLTAVSEGSGRDVLVDELRTRTVAQLQSFRPMLSMMAGGVEISDDQVIDAVSALEGELVDLLPTVRPVVEAHLGESLRLGELISDRLGSLDKLKFERMLRGIFEEDEWILVVVGGALGAAIGALQGGIVLGFGL